MQIDDLEKLAFKNEKMPDELDLPEQCYYLALRSLFADFREKRIGKEQTAKEKQALRQRLTNFNWDKKNHDYYMEVTGIYQTSLLKSSDLRSKVNKSEDLEEIALACCEAVSLLTGDKSFFEINSKKIKRLGGKK